jgi:predicted metal-dependent peptidase
VRIDLLIERDTRAARTRRIALAMYASGSIDKSLLRRFAAEAPAVSIQYEPPLWLIVCDADVHHQNL